MQVFRKSPKFGNWLHYTHDAEAYAAGYEQIDTGEKDEKGEPIYSEGDTLFGVDWQDAWGDPVTEEALTAWDEPEPEPMPVNIERIFSDAYAAAPINLNALKKAVWDYRVANGTNPTQATGDGVDLVLRFGPELGAYKDAGGHPKAAQALYTAVAGAAVSNPESVDPFPWLTAPVLEIFAAYLAPS